MKFMRGIISTAIVKSLVNPVIPTWQPSVNYPRLDGALQGSLRRDRIVVGTNENSVWKHLLQSGKLDLEKAIRICRSNETNMRQASIHHA